MTGHWGQFVVAIVLALAAAARAEPVALAAPAEQNPQAANESAAIVEPSSADAPVPEADTGQAPVPPADSPDRPGVEGRPLGGRAADAGPKAPDRPLYGSAGRPMDWWRTLGALVLVVALILALRWLLRRGARLRSAGSAAQVIEVLSRTGVSARQSLLLVRVGRRLLVVGAAPESMTTLAQIDDPAQVAELIGSLEQARANSLSNSFARALGQWRTGGDLPADALEADTSSAPRTPAGGAADRLADLAQKVRDVGSSPGRRP